MLFQESALLDSLSVAGQRRATGSPKRPTCRPVDVRRRVEEDPRVYRNGGSISTGRALGIVRRTAAPRGRRARHGRASRGSSCWTTRPSGLRSDHGEDGRRRDRQAPRCRSTLPRFWLAHQLPDAFYVATHEAVRQNRPLRHRQSGQAHDRRGDVYHAQGREGVFRRIGRRAEGVDRPPSADGPVWVGSSSRCMIDFRLAADGVPL